MSELHEMPKVKIQPLQVVACRVIGDRDQSDRSNHVLERDHGCYIQLAVGPLFGVSKFICKIYITFIGVE